VLLLGPAPLSLLTALAAQASRRPSPPACLLVFLFCWCVLQAGLALLLGILHAFALLPILLAELALFAAGALAISRAIPGRFRSSLAQAFSPQTPFGRLDSLLAAALVLVGLALLWRSAASPIVEYDSLAFHLPAMATWLQDGTFTRLAQFKSNTLNAYPYTWEALCALNLAPFHEDFLVALPNLLAWALLGLSIYCLAAQFGASRARAMAAAGLVLTLPASILQVNTMHVDLPFAAFFSAGLYFAAGQRRTGSRLYLALLLAALGMLVGIKASGFLYGIVLLAAPTLLRPNADQRPEHPGATPSPSGRLALGLGAVIVGCSLLSGYWYLRNLHDLGNPFGYVRVQMGHLTLLPGTMSLADVRRTTLAAVFDPHRLSQWKLLFNQVVGQFNWQFLALPLEAFWLLPALLARQPRLEKRRALGLLALLAATAGLYWTTPFSGSYAEYRYLLTPWTGQAMRYGLPFVGLLGVAAAAGGAARATPQIGLAAVALISATLAMAGGRVLYLFLGVMSLAVLLPHFGPFFARARLALNRTPTRILLPLILAAALSAGTFQARTTRDGNRQVAYAHILDYLDRQPQEHVIGYLWSHQSYLLYGRNLRTKVIFVPWDGYQTRDQWVNDLHRRGIRLVALGPLHPGGGSSARLAWLDDAKGPFARVFSAGPDWLVLYRLKEGRPPPATRSRQRLGTRRQEGPVKKASRA